MTRLTDYLNQTLYVVIIDYGKIGIGSADMTPDSSLAQEQYDGARNDDEDAVVWAIEGGTQIDVTDIFERRYQDWLDACPRKDEWGNEREEKEERV